MRTVTYVPSTDQIFGVADGGSLWRGNLDGSEWTVLNDDFLLHPEVLESFIPTDSTNVRLVGASGKYILTSDDEGKTWAEATFTPDFYDGWGSPRQMTILPDSAQTMYYLAQTWMPTRGLPASGFTARRTEGRALSASTFFKLKIRED